MKDDRLYNRLNINVLCNIYLDDYIEVVGTLKNISESGIYIDIAYSDELKNKLEIGTVLKIQGTESYNYIDTDKISVFNEVLKIVRIENKINKLGIACKVSERCNSYYNYVTDKKVADYVNKLNNI